MIEETLRALENIVKTKFSRTLGKPGIGLILGSGLGGIADEVREGCRIPYAQIPHFVYPTVEGHLGEMIIGKLEGKEVCVMKGRAHFYEGYTMKEVTFPVRLMARMGIKILIITGAAGGINENFKPQDLVLIKDHINLMGDNPLMGEKTGDGTISFIDMNEVYDKYLLRAVLNCAKTLKIKLRQGVYIGVRGPSYETPAEIRMARRMGADLVGMSVVPEATVAKQLGLKIVGISCITNISMATSKEPTSHAVILKIAESIRPKLSRLLKEVIKRI